MLAVIPVHAYDAEVTEHHAALLAYTAAQGQCRGAHDLIVAATARVAGRTILTTDLLARFGELPGVNSRTVA